jgi:tripartite-type tricarboxylate transporter receptor subunit TctC
MALVVRKDLPVNTFEEFIALAQKSKDKPLSFASTGVGSLYHLIGEKFGQTSKGSVLHVPFNGLAPMMTNLIGGQVDFAFAPIAGPVPGFIENNSVKILGVTSKTQHPRFPKAPLLKDTKAYEDFVFSIWAGVHANVKTPDAIAAVLHKSAYAALAVPEARKTLEASGMNLAAPMSLAELATFYKSETDNYRAIAKAINLQAQ